MPSSVVSTMGTLVPYITVDELKRSPIYTQLRKLVPGNSQADNDAELGRIIQRASALINGECRQNLAATVDHEVGRVTVSDFGELRIHTRNSPIVSVSSVMVGPDPYSLAAVDLSYAVLDPWRITIPRAALNQSALNLPSWGRSGQQLWADWTYINGFPVTTLASAVAAGATTVTVVNATGIVAGQTLLTVEDGKWLEYAVPTAVSGNVLTIAPLAYPHQAGVGVTALPDDIKEAMLLLISRLHDTWSLTMGAVSVDGSGAHQNVPRPTVMCDCAVILQPYRRQW